MQDYNGWPVKVDSAHRLWVYGVVLGHCPGLPASTRGWLKFRTEDVNLLTGPWGPDPADYLMLSGEVIQPGAAEVEGLLSVALQPGVPELELLLPRPAVGGHLPGRRVWLAIPLPRIDYMLGAHAPRRVSNSG